MRASADQLLYEVPDMIDKDSFHASVYMSTFASCGDLAQAVTDGKLGSHTLGMLKNCVKKPNTSTFFLVRVGACSIS